MKTNKETNTPVITDQQLEMLKRKKKRKMSRRMKHGGYATVMIVAVIAVIVILNVVVSMLGSMYGLRLDLTSDETYALSEDVKPYVVDNEKPVDIYVMSEEVDLTGYQQLIQLNSMLKEFAGLNENISLHYVDLISDPTFNANYPDLELGQYDVLFDCGGSTRLMNLNDLFPTTRDTQTGATTYSSNVEQKLLSALITVTADRHAKVGFLGGHDELNAQPLMELLEDNGYLIYRNEQLAVGLTEDFDALVICAPSRDYSEEELKLLDTFLNNNEQYGKNLFYFAEVSQPELPNLEAFLSEWGAVIGKGVAVESDTNKMYYQNPYYPIATYANAEDKYSGIFSERNVNLVTPRVREMSLAFTESRNRNAIVLLNMSDTSFVIPDVENPIGFDDAEVKGSIPVAIVGDRSRYDDEGELLRSCVFTVASYSMLDTSFLNNASVLNGDYAINLFNRTLVNYELVYIAPKSFDQQPINITSGQANSIAIAFAVVLPLAVLACGLVVFLRRRHK